MALRLVVAIPALLVTVGGLSCTKTNPTPSVSFGPAISIPGSTATLTRSLEPYFVRLNRNPEEDRFEVQLRLVDPTGVGAERLIPIAAHLRITQLHTDARLLGDDGYRLWFYVTEIGAWDYSAGRLLTAADFRRANPRIGLLPAHDNTGDPLIAPSVRRLDVAPQDLWSGEARRYQFDGRLRVTTPDFTRVFGIDPASLRAVVE